MVIGDLLLRNVKKTPDKTAIVCWESGLRFSFKEFNARVNSISNALLRLGVEKGDRLAVLLQNCHYYPELYFAAAKGGMVIVPLNFRSVGRELMYFIDNSGANSLIFGEEYLEVISSIRKDLAGVKNFIIIGRPTRDMESYEDLVDSHSTEEPSMDVDEENLIAIIYTSGTTGVPKGTMITHKNWIINTRNTIATLNFREDDTTLHITPFFHAAPVWPMLSHMYVGGCNVLLKKFDPNTVLDIIEREKITTINTLPIMILRLLNYPQLKQYDVSSLRLISYGGAPMPFELLKEAMKTFGHIFAQVYGLTESGPLITCLLPEDHILEGSMEKINRITSCGKTIVNVEVKLLNEKGETVQAGEVGEITARGDTMMKGYWKMKEATEEAMQDGWLHTGDMGRMDDDGYIYIVDRKKDMIISGGENIYSREIENVIYSHPSVQEVAVIGIPDEEWGEAVLALIVPKEGEVILEEEIIDFCKKQLASYKKPKKVEFLKYLPRTESGKIWKKELKEKYQKKNKGL
ncbi:MAG: long-chain-fatty-acid--CoA ligase [Thermodesulfobacteriota bacterium]|nr:long-chain-fatty-acid--CoA ligase [Thermodesulfobacteriota bacterium]